MTNLPRGLHKLEIRKEGYIPYKARIDLKKTRTLFAQLEKKSESIAAPTKKREQIIQADCPKGMEVDTRPPMVDPSAVMIPFGKFKMGDINGNGLENERPVVEKTISESFAMQSKEVTVGAFEAFVNETQYKTEAEKGKGCAYYLNGEPVWEASLNWRAPGFEQTNEFPAVCLTKIMLLLTLNGFLIKQRKRIVYPLRLSGNMRRVQALRQSTHGVTKLVKT